MTSEEEFAEDYIEKYREDLFDENPIEFEESFSDDGGAIDE